MSFKKRRINVRFQVGQGANGEDGFVDYIIEGLRVVAHINSAGGPSMGTADIQIYGMTLDQMNAIATQGMIIINQRRSNIIVEAGTDEDGTATIFAGTIQTASVQFDAAPETCLNVFALTGLFDKVKTAIPTSFTGPADTATVMNGFANLLGLFFENNGVMGSLPTSYFYGSIYDQMDQCARAGGIGKEIVNGITLAIWPRGGSRGGKIPLISQETGLVNVPSYTSQGIHFRTEFNRDIGFQAQVEVQCILQPPNAYGQGANGLWVVSMISHILESETPGGAWFTDVETYRPGGTADIGHFGTDQ